MIRHIGSTELPSVPAALVREALFLIATANAQTQQSARIAQAFDLHAQLPLSESANTLMANGDRLSITALNSETRSLIALLDTQRTIALPAPEQLDNLIQSTRLVP